MQNFIPPALKLREESEETDGQATFFPYMRVRDSTIVIFLNFQLALLMGDDWKLTLFQLILLYTLAFKYIFIQNLALRDEIKT